MAARHAIDVAVIGGGIAGTATAAYLARAGASVALFERTAIGAGASGRNSGVLQRPLDPVLAELHVETLSLYRDLAASLEGDFALPAAPAGLLLVSRDVPAVRALTDRLAAAHPALGAAFLEPAEVRRLEPALHPSIAACRLDTGYPIRPEAATQGFATLAQRHGVSIEIGGTATPAIDGDRATGVIVDGRRVPSGAVVVAAGPWTPWLLDPAGPRVPIRPLWGVVVDLELGERPRHVLEEADIDDAIEPAEPAAAGDKRAPENQPDHGLAFSLVTADGANTLGSTFLDQEPDVAALVPRIVQRGAAFVPAVGTARVRGTRLCARPVSADGRPLVGAVPWLAGAYVVAGHGPWGISTAPATAHKLADLVLDRGASVPSQLDPARFLAAAATGQRPRMLT